MKLLPTTLLLLATSLCFSSFAKDAELLSLKNLERERAALVEAQLSSKVDVDIKQRKVEELTRRMVDLERMVLRDERLTNNDHPLVQKTFQNFDATFLVHAGAEQGNSPFEQWLAVSQMSSEAILATRAGAR